MLVDIYSCMKHYSVFPRSKDFENIVGEKGKNTGKKLSELDGKCPLTHLKYLVYKSFQFCESTILLSGILEAFLDSIFFDSLPNDSILDKS